MNILRISWSTCWLYEG